MELLPKDQWTLQLSTDGKHVIAGLWEDRGYRHFKRYPLAELPNELIRAADLEQRGLLPKKEQQEA